MPDREKEERYRMKKEVNINGKIVFPLQEGNRAVISTGGSFIYTSPVVEILEDRTDFVCFETMNSVYKVCLQPVPIRAVIPPFMKMCA